MYEPSSKSCCSIAHGDWNATCEVCMFPDMSKSEKQIKYWTACYKGQQNCMWAKHKNDKKNSAAAAGAKVKLLAVVVAATFTALS